MSTQYSLLEVYLKQDDNGSSLTVKLSHNPFIASVECFAQPFNDLKSSVDTGYAL